MLAVHERDGSSHVVHAIEVGASRAQQRRSLARVEAWAQATREIPSTLGVQCWSLWAPGRLALVTRYTGSSAGLVTLDSLVAGRGGRLPLSEVVRAMTPLIGTLRAAISKGVVHGPVSMGEVLVDQHGQVCVEHFGLAAALAGRGAGPQDDLSRCLGEEIASIASIAVRLATGRSAGQTWANARANSREAADAAVAAWVRGFVMGGPAVATAAAGAEALIALLRECDVAGGVDSPAESPTPSSPQDASSGDERGGGLRGVVDRILSVFRRVPR